MVLMGTWEMQWRERKRGQGTDYEYEMNGIDITIILKPSPVLPFTQKMEWHLEETWKFDLSYFGRWH